MFLEMFGASALATILFSNNSKEKDYSNNFYSLERKLDSVIDTQTFMKARLSLTEFNTKLIGEPSLTLENHSYESIMAAAKEGFQKLLDVAVADENNYKSARELFNGTYGNINWVKEKFRFKVEIIESFIEEYESSVDKLDNSLAIVTKYHLLKDGLKETSKIRFIKLRKIKKELKEMENLPNLNKMLNDPMVLFHLAKKNSYNGNFINCLMVDIVNGIDIKQYDYLFLLHGKFGGDVIKYYDYIR